MQSYSPVTSGMFLSNSLTPLTNNDLTILSNSSGAAFPTANLQAGMCCFRTDLNKLYLLKDTTPTWELVMDLNQTALPVNNPTFTGQMNIVDGNSYIKRVGSASGILNAIAGHFNSSATDMNNAVNAYWDGAAWQRWNTGQPSYNLVVNTTGLTLNYAAAGTGAITWTPYSVWHAGNFNPANYLGVSAQAADSAKLGGTVASAYALLSGNPNFTGTPQKNSVALATVNDTVANAAKWNGANKTVSTALPSGGVDGDVWFQYS